MLRRRKYENSTSVNVPPLDSDEQEEVVTSLVCQAERQSDAIKRAFLFFLALFALATASSLFQFRRTFTEPLIERAALDILWDAGLIVTFVGHVFGLNVAREITQDNRRHASLGMVVSSTNVFVWLAVLVWRRVTNAFLYWIPLCPAVAIGLSLYISSSERKLKSELKDLKRAQYNHKKL